MALASIDDHREGEADAKRLGGGAFGVPNLSAAVRLRYPCLRVGHLRLSAKSTPITHVFGSDIEDIGSAGRIRTYDQPVNSRLLYR